MLIGSDPPYFVNSGENGYGEPPSDEQLGQWVSYAYQYRDNRFIASHILGDFSYNLSVNYILEASESDTTKIHTTDDKAIILDYFSKAEYNFSSLSDFTQKCKLAIEENNKPYVEAGFGRYSYGEIINKKGFSYFTYTETVLGETEFSIIACYETDNGFCAIEIIGNNTGAENEFVEIASALRG